jgi:hypothetical protein
MIKYKLVLNARGGEIEYSYLRVRSEAEAERMRDALRKSGDYIFVDFQRLGMV